MLKNTYIGRVERYEGCIWKQYQGYVHVYYFVAFVFDVALQTLAECSAIDYKPKERRPMQEASTFG